MQSRAETCVIDLQGYLASLSEMSTLAHASLILLGFLAALAMGSCRVERREASAVDAVAG